MFDYNPMSPAQWGLVPLSVHTYVYRDITAAIAALDYWVQRIWSKRASDGEAPPTELPFRILYRGESDISTRLLPSLLSGPRPKPDQPERYRYAIEGSDAVRNENGDWFEKDPEFRSADRLLDNLSAEWLSECGSRERDALNRAMQFPEIVALDPFRRLAAVRHYGGTPSPILDVTTSLKVAAYFASHSGSSNDSRTRAGKIGVLWAIDLTMLARLFKVKIANLPEGTAVTLTVPKKEWGDNEKMFADQSIPTVSVVFRDSRLPLPRPLAQKGAFLSFTREDGTFLPLRAQLHWWSLIERWSYSCGFIHTGQGYTEEAENIATAALFPAADKYLSIAGTNMGA